ncbi:MAG TPA: DUF1801 domain-containing protein [Bacteroidia bacterium]|nr:DUF1801 domain-containing protein [Bacteroidia bacterium]
MIAPAKNVDAYIARQPVEMGIKLEKIRKLIKDLVPEVEEVISYGMPAYKYHGILVWYAAFKNHIGFYPKASGIAAFKKELSVYKNAKGSVQFPLDKTLPIGLISKIVKYRVKENLSKSKNNA